MIVLEMCNSNTKTLVNAKTDRMLLIRCKAHAAPSDECIWTLTDVASHFSSIRFGRKADVDIELHAVIQYAVKSM